jgi:membrane protein
MIKKIKKFKEVNKKEIFKKVVNFFDDDISYYASSLSFYTFFSIVPLLLILLSILPNLPMFEGYYAKLQTFIFSNIAPTNHQVIAGYINSFLDNSLKMGIVGLIYVLVATLMFFRNFESLANKIFNIEPQSFIKSIPVYWTMITLSPIGLALSFYISGVIQTFLDKIFITNLINLLEVLPFLIIWFIFYLTFKIIINRDLKFKSTFYSSFLTSVVWYLAKSLFVYYVFYNDTYSNMYGSFSAIFFFMLWIYFSWMIFLYGLKVCSIIEFKCD